MTWNKNDHSMAVTSPGIDTEQNMVALLKKGDYAAFGGLYDEYAPSLLAIIRHITNNEPAADEILRAAFVQVWLNRATYNPAIERLFSWMLGITRQVAFTMIPPADLPAQLGAAKMPGIEEEQKWLLHLVYFKGYSMERVAKELRMEPDVVKTKVINAMKQLKGGWVA